MGSTVHMASARVREMSCKLAVVAVAFSALPAEASQPRIGFTSFGSAKIGMSQDEVEQAVGQKLVASDADDDPAGCRYMGSATGTPGVQFMMIGGKLVRMDVRSSRVKTVSGAHIGMSQSEIIQLYGRRAVVSPHAYTSPYGHYITIHSEDGASGIRFETDKGKVTTFYAGTAEAIQFIEGCL